MLIKIDGNIKPQIIEIQFLMFLYLKYCLKISKKIKINATGKNCILANKTHPAIADIKKAFLKFNFPALRKRRYNKIVINSVAINSLV